MKLKLCMKGQKNLKSIGKILMKNLVALQHDKLIQCSREDVISHPRTRIKILQFKIQVAYFSGDYEKLYLVFNSNNTIQNAHI